METRGGDPIAQRHDAKSALRASSAAAVTFRSCAEKFISAKESEWCNPKHALKSGARKQDGTGARALEFAILIAARSGEVRGAKWAEFDLAGADWRIPGERMKAGAGDLAGAAG